MKNSELNESPGAENLKKSERRHLDEYEIDLLLQFFNILHRWDRELKAKQQTAWTTTKEIQDSPIDE